MAKLRHPAPDQGAGARLGADVGERDGLNPPGGALDHGEKVGDSLGDGEGSDQVDMKWAPGQWRPHVNAHFRPLARQTDLAAMAHIPLVIGPHKHAPNVLGAGFRASGPM